MSVPSMGFTFMAVGPSGDLPSVGAGSDRSGRDFSSDAGTGETGPAPAGRIRRSHDDAHNHHGDGPQREVDRRLLRHLGHSRFRVSLGLHGVLALADTDFILTRSIRLGNTDHPA